MRNYFIILFLLFTSALCGQSSSITRFRSAFKENSNMFFYSSTLKMLNTENNPELADILKDIEEIRILNYTKTEQQFTGKDVSELKNNLKKEMYNPVMIINEKGSSVNLYSRDKKGKTIGFVALVENNESLVLIDLVGTIDMEKFMKLRQNLDVRTGNAG